MKRTFLKLASTVTAFTLLSTQAAPALNVFAEDTIETSGRCGVDLYWDYADGTLTISGSSPYIYDKLAYAYTESAYPWYPLRDEITDVVFDADCGLTKIPHYAFTEYEHLTNVTLPSKLRMIDSYAFDMTNITEITIPESVIYIEPGNFGYYASETGKTYCDCTVYGAANSAASNYCLDTGCTFSATEGVLQEVNITADTWSFANVSKDFQQSADDYISYMNPEHLETYRKNATNTDYLSTKGMLESYWVGSCLGMSSLLTLCRNDVLSPSDIQAGAETIQDIQMNSDLESLLNYYSVMLNGYACNNLQFEFKKKTDAERVEILLDYAQKAHDNGTSFLVVVQGGEHGGHALVGVDKVSGAWTFEGLTYDTCVQMLDPNYANQIFMGSSIYINTETGAWIQPNRDMGNTGVLATGFFACTDSVDTLNFRGLLNGSNAYDATMTKNCEVHFSGYDVYHTTVEITNVNGELLSSYSNGTNFVFKRPTTIYSDEDAVTIHRTIEEDTDDTSALSMTVRGHDYYYVVTGNDAEYMTVSPNQFSFEISDWAVKHKFLNVPYKFKMTFDEERFQDEFPWDTIRIEVNRKDVRDGVVKDGSVTQKENGYVLSGDMLKGATVYLQQAKEEPYREIKLSTNEPSVLITCDENKTPILLADQDGDGTYETLMDESFDDEKVVAYDMLFATLILKYYANAAAGLDVSDWNTEYFDVNEDGSIDVQDAAWVLKKYAEAAAGLA